MPSPPTRLPSARGPISAALLGALRGSHAGIRLPPIAEVDGLGDDVQVALRTCYDLHYTEFEGVADGWEWDPELLGARRLLERAFVEGLVGLIGAPHPVSPSDAIADLLAVANGDGPSLSGYCELDATREQVREFVVHRSAYQRKEADPHTWAIPRLRGRAKAAMVAIQYDEYGEGVTEDIHAELFAVTMRAFDLDDSYGAYVDLLPAVTLATDNLPTLFGLHRAWHAACVGHLALFEMTSVGPMGRYSRALARLGIGAAARRFYDVHVEADAIHERVALEDMVAGLLEDDPGAPGRLRFGALALAAVERRFAAHVLDAWSAGRTSLRRELAPETEGTRPDLGCRPVAPVTGATAATTIKERRP